MSTGIGTWEWAGWEWAGTERYLAALGSHAHGSCAHHVRMAIAAGGIHVTGTNYAKDLGPNLLAKGFTCVYNGNSADLTKMKPPLQRGDVAVISGFLTTRQTFTNTIRPKYNGEALHHTDEKGKKQLVPHTAGHAAIYDGSFWYSDFKQTHSASPYPGSEYRSVKPSYKIYRYDGIIRPTLQDAVKSLAATLSLPLAPVVQNGLTTAVKFLNNNRDRLSRELCWHLGLGIGPKIARPEKAEDYVEYYLRGIDFHSAVIVTTLLPGTLLSRHESKNARAINSPSICDLKDRFPDPSFKKPFIFFTKPGVSPLQTGTSFPISRFREFTVMRIVRALQSTAAGIRFTKPGTPDIDRGGGGVQFILRKEDANALSVKYVSGVKSRSVDRLNFSKFNDQPFL